LSTPHKKLALPGCKYLILGTFGIIAGKFSSQWTAVGGWV